MTDFDKLLAEVGTKRPVREQWIDTQPEEAQEFLRQVARQEAERDPDSRTRTVSIAQVVRVLRREWDISVGHSTITRCIDRLVDRMHNEQS